MKAARTLKVDTVEEPKGGAADIVITWHVHFEAGPVRPTGERHQDVDVRRAAMVILDRRVIELDTDTLPELIGKTWEQLEEAAVIAAAEIDSDDDIRDSDDV